MCWRQATNRKCPKIKIADENKQKKSNLKNSDKKLNYFHSFSLVLPTRYQIVQNDSRIIFFVCSIFRAYRLSVPNSINLFDYWKRSKEATTLFTESIIIKTTSTFGFGRQILPNGKYKYYVYLQHMMVMMKKK